MDGNGTSLKSLIQSMQVKDGSVHEGVVESVSPMKIKLKNDEKFEVRSKMLTIPSFFSDMTVEIEARRENGSIYKTTGVIHNSLKVGDVVSLLSYNNFKNYIVIGRVG